MPALTDLRDQTCIVGIGETAYTRGTPKSALELALEAWISAIEDAGIKPEVIDAVILPSGAGSGGTAGDFCANLGLQDLHYTTSLQEMGGAMRVSAVESAAVALASGIANYALIPLCSRFYSGRKARRNSAIATSWRPSLLPWSGRNGLLTWLRASTSAAKR